MIYMNLDGLTMSVLTRELSQALLDGQLQRIYQIDKTTLVCKIHTGKENHDLVITVGNKPAIYLSPPLQDLPKEPTSLCMFLRKHIEGSRITTVEQIHSDRIICIHMDKLELNGTILRTNLYIELMGKYSNCIFVQNGIILDALIHVTPLMNRERTIMPKMSYDLPPNANRVSLFDFSVTEIENLLHAFHQDTLSNTIRAIFNGFGTPLLKEVLYRSQLSKSITFDEITQEQCQALASNLYELGKEINSSHQLYEYTFMNKAVISPIPLQYDTFDEPIMYDTLSKAIATAIQKSGAIATADKALEKKLLQAIKKEELRHSKIQQELDDTSHMDQYKKYGDLLMIYAHLPVHYKEEITVDNLLVSPTRPITIPLDPQLTVSGNAQRYYKLYTKLKNRIQSGRFQLEQSSRKLDYLQSIVYSLSLCQDKMTLQEIYNECMDLGIIKKSKKPLSYKLKKENFIHLTLDDGDVYIGKNNKQNDYLTHTFAKPTDLWFHTTNIQGSHVILRSSHEPSEDTIIKVARYAAFYSKAKDSSKVPVDYVRVRYIKKPPASPLGFVTFTNQKTLYVDPLEPELELIAKS